MQRYVFFFLFYTCTNLNFWQLLLVEIDRTTLPTHTNGHTSPQQTATTATAWKRHTARSATMNGHKWQMVRQGREAVPVKVWGGMIQRISDVVTIVTGASRRDTSWAPGMFFFTFFFALLIISYRSLWMTTTTNLNERPPTPNANH